MKGIRARSGKLLSVLLASAALSVAQTESGLASALQPSTARPGTVNYVEGQASLSGQELSGRSAQNSASSPGQSLETQDGYLELLLTPGAFLRLGHKSEARMLSTGLADTQLELLSGSAMVEVDQIVDGTHLAIAMHNANTAIEKKGLYAFDADDQTIRVLNGKALVTSDGRKQKLGKHDEVALAGEHSWKKHDFDDKALKSTPLYVWSSVRSHDLAQASVGAASDASAFSFAGNGWYWNPYTSYYGFWPSSGLLYSPFGYGFYSPSYFGGYPGGGLFGYGGGWYGGPRWHGRSGWAGRPGQGRVSSPRIAPPVRSGGFASGGGSRSAGGIVHGGAGGHR